MYSKLLLSMRLLSLAQVLLKVCLCAVKKGVRRLQCLDLCSGEGLQIVLKVGLAGSEKNELSITCHCSTALLVGDGNRVAGHTAV